MDKKELQQKLRANYNRDTWKEVLLEMFPEAELFAQDRPTAFTREEQRNLANHILQFGEVDLDGDTLIFLEVELKPDSVQLTRNRVGLRKLVDNEVIAGLTDGALISYYQPETDEWRITFYSERYGWDEDGNTIKEETHPKRYTYVVGPSEFCKTAAGQLVKVIEKGRENSLENVLMAFSVQKVSKEFFKEYKEHYDKFVGYLTGEIWKKSGVQEVDTDFTQLNAYFGHATDPKKEARDFAKKLLGRIVFLYFVQKKKWIGSATPDFKDGDTNFIYNLFHEVEEDQQYNFYSQWLSPLFFETLNRDNDHRFEMPDGETVYIPFLNGGLFEMDETDKKAQGISLPANLFSHSNERTREVPIERGFLDFLSAYNFTIHEDSPGDHTIAVDPEMLGHIFENLLEGNKDKGAYYTPKPIVHYMCQESLIEYLLTELTSEQAEDSEREELRGHLEDLIKKQEAGELVSFTEEILKSLKEVKICDPAIGSGAFPMGILQEIYQAVETLHHLSPDNVRSIWELPDDDWHPAVVKKQIIQNSIYGVDIEKGAVDIARLRFWLSLIVDEKEPTALPNLDYKIVVGDSLVSKFEGELLEIQWDLEDSQSNMFGHEEFLKRQKLLNKITLTQKKYFEAGANQKKKLVLEVRNQKIDLLINQLALMIQSKGQDKKPRSSDKKFEERMRGWVNTQRWKQLIQTLKNLKENPEKPFEHFEWKLDFPEILNHSINENAGFDVVIGNPPYIQLQKDKGKLADLYENNGFQTFERTGDIYSLFYEKGFELLNESGVHTFITSNKWMRTNYGKSLRKYFSQKNPVKIIDLGQGVFQTAVVDTNILIAKNEDYKNDLTGVRITDKEQISKLSELNYIQVSVDSEEMWVILEEIEGIIKYKLEEAGQPLKSWDIKINYGVKTGRNTAFVIDESIKNMILSREPFAEDIIKPVLQGKDVNRYAINFRNKYLINTHNGVKEEDLDRIEINDYPVVKEYLDQFYEDLASRYDQGDTPYNLRNCAYLLDFEEPKIMYQEMVQEGSFYLDEEGKYYCLDTARIISGSNLKYLLAIFNSKLFFYSIKKFYGGGGLGNSGVRMKHTFIENFPVVEYEDLSLFDARVDQILTQKEANPDADTTDLEQQIDTLVYKLYNLTWEEVQVVDPDFGLSEEEYEAVNLENN